MRVRNSTLPNGCSGALRMGRRNRWGWSGGSGWSPPSPSTRGTSPTRSTVQTRSTTQHQKPTQFSSYSPWTTEEIPTHPFTHSIISVPTTRSAVESKVPWVGDGWGFSQRPVRRLLASWVDGFPPHSQRHVRLIVPEHSRPHHTASWQGAHDLNMRSW